MGRIPSIIAPQRERGQIQPILETPKKNYDFDLSWYDTLKSFLQDVSNFYLLQVEGDQVDEKDYNLRNNTYRIVLYARHK